MIKFLINLFNKITKTEKTPKTGAFFGSSEYELNNFLCGIGKSEILESQIRITEYPFEPSSIYPEKLIEAKDIEGISWDSYPPLLKLKNEILFITREQSELLELFKIRNNINSFIDSRNWERLLEPYIDSEYTKETDINYSKLLNENGITNDEIEKIREEVKDQMLKYNFDTMLWEWGSLGLSDVLSAMRVKYNKDEFSDFYKRAMEIQLRIK